MRLKVDANSDALYFRLDDAAVVESEEVEPGVILDFNATGQVVGIQLLGLSGRISPEPQRVLQIRDGWAAC